MQGAGEGVGFGEEVVKLHAEVGEAEIGRCGRDGLEAAETQQAVEGGGVQAGEFFGLRPVEAGEE